MKFDLLPTNARRVARWLAVQAAQAVAWSAFILAAYALLHWAAS